MGKYARMRKDPGARGGLAPVAQACSPEGTGLIAHDADAFQQDQVERDPGNFPRGISNGDEPRTVARRP